MEQLCKEDVAVFGTCSLHGGINDDKQNWKHQQVSGQWQHTECIEKSLHFSWSIHGTKHLIWGEEHHSTKVVVDSDDWRVVQYQRSS